MILRKMSAFCGAISIAINVVHAAPERDASPPLQEAVQQFLIQEGNAVRRGDSDSVFVPKILALYEKLLGKIDTPLVVVELPIPTLNDYFRAANEAAFYTFSERSRKDLVVIANELEHRGVLSKVQMRDVFKALVAAREFDLARDWHRQHETMIAESLPQVEDNLPRDTDQPTVLVVSQSNNSATRRLYEFPQTGSIIVAAHPNCHFSQNAIAEITADPILWNQWKGHVAWITPQSRNYDAAAVRQWNSMFPDVKMMMAYRESEWPSIDSWETPVFYFFNSGRLVTTVVGWPQGGKMDALYAASRLIGLNKNDLKHYP